MRPASWIDGQAQPTEAAGKGRGPLQSYDDVLARFPAASQVDPARRTRVQELKDEFLSTQPAPADDVEAFWLRYGQVFSRDGLHSPDADALHYFANNAVGASVGNMSRFNDAWTEHGSTDASHRVAEATAYLLYGEIPPGARGAGRDRLVPREEHVADRLTFLLQPDCPLGMTGWKESLMTKTLSVVYPERFIAINKYGDARTLDNTGKRGLAHLVWGLQMPSVDHTSTTRGRLIVWSNDLLLELCGDGFHPGVTHGQHVSAFLWWLRAHPDKLQMD